MAALIGNVDGLTLLEPSVGNGALLGRLQGSPKHIDAFDVDPAVLAAAKTQCTTEVLCTHCADFVDTFTNGFIDPDKNRLRRRYDAVISNPPFGLRFTKEYRQLLKSTFPMLYVRESYGLFLAFSIMLLRDEGRYVFLLPDTFLTSTHHSRLRRFIYDFGRPSHIIRFPSKRFETVSFGYGNLCIISGKKKKTSKRSQITWIDAFNKNLSLLEQCEIATRLIGGDELYTSIHSGWHANIGKIRSETQGWPLLGAVADCKTGIYTGDNSRFIGYDPARVAKRLNGHPIYWNKVFQGPLSFEERQNGLDGDQIYVPLVRGGHRPFAEKTAWALRWDKDAINFYKENKKARFQNSQFYFRSGLAVPMVTSRRLSASLMDNAVFDQGVVGVFPTEEDAREALLLYLNSSIATELRNEMVNGSANNSANYLKRLPVPRFTKEHYKKAKTLIRRIANGKTLSTEICDEFIRESLTKRGS